MTCMGRATMPNPRRDEHEHDYLVRPVLGVDTEVVNPSHICNFVMSLAVDVQGKKGELGWRLCAPADGEVEKKCLGKQTGSSQYPVQQRNTRQEQQGTQGGLCNDFRLLLFAASAARCTLLFSRSQSSAFALRSRLILTLAAQSCSMPSS